jgi:hypothetical protein
VKSLKSTLVIGLLVSDMCRHIDRHWFTISIEGFEIKITQFLLSNSNVAMFKFKLHDSRVQILNDIYSRSNSNHVFKYFSLIFHPGQKMKTIID